MTRVGLILTGESERGGMTQALGRGFPGTTFELVPGRHQGFTCTKIPPVFTPEAAEVGPQLVEVLINTLDEHGGVAALRGLDWPQVFGQVTECCFARSLFEDIASMLGCPNPYSGTCASETWSAQPSTLRNI